MAREMILTVGNIVLLAVTTVMYINIDIETKKEIDKIKQRQIFGKPITTLMKLNISIKHHNEKDSTQS